MRQTLTALSVLLVAPLLAGLATGCTASDVGYAGSSSLYEIPEGAAVLDSIEPGSWQAAPAGCEDLLPDNVSFEIASGTVGLLVAIDNEGKPICTDTFEAIAEELDDEGRGQESDDLEASLMLTLGDFEDAEHERMELDPAADDPSPQPSRPDPEAETPPTMDMAGGDPDPQGDDPSPQPS